MCSSGWLKCLVLTVCLLVASCSRISLEDIHVKTTSNVLGRKKFEHIARQTRNLLETSFSPNKSQTKKKGNIPFSNFTTSCPPTCTTYGTCNEELGRCDCPIDRSGPDCSQLLARNVLVDRCFFQRIAEKDCNDPTLKCLNDCNGRGICITGFCKCLPGLYGVDCSLSLDAQGKPTILAGQGYVTRRKRPSVYVYELPPELITWYSMRRLDRPIHVHFYQRMLSSGARVADGDQADWFFIPVKARDTGDTKFIMAAIEYISLAYPWYRRLRGSRHFLIFTGDVGKQDLGESFRREIKSGPVSNITWLTHWGLYWDNPVSLWKAAHRTKQDVVIPVMLSGSRYQQFSMDRTPMHPLAPASDIPERKIQLYFAGRICGDRKTPVPYPFKTRDKDKDKDKVQVQGHGGTKGDSTSKSESENRRKANVFLGSKKLLTLASSATNDASPKKAKEGDSPFDTWMDYDLKPGTATARAPARARARAGGDEDQGGAEWKEEAAGKKKAKGGVGVKPRKSSGSAPSLDGNGNTSTTSELGKSDAEVVGEFGKRPYPCSNLNTGYSANSRQQVYRLFWDQPGFRLRVHDDKVGQFFAASRFCFAALGGGHGQRQILVSYLGCVPLLVSDYVMDPFEPALNWTDFSVKLTTDKIPHIAEILDKISDSELKRKQSLLHCQAQHLVYSSIHGGFMGESARYDAFETTLEYLRVMGDHPGADPSQFTKIDAQFRWFMRCDEPGRPDAEPDGTGAGAVKEDDDDAPRAIGREATKEEEKKKNPRSSSSTAAEAVFDSPNAAFMPARAPRPCTWSAYESQWQQCQRLLSSDMIHGTPGGAMCGRSTNLARCPRPWL